MPRRDLHVDIESILDAMAAYGDVPHSYLDRDSGCVEVWIDPADTGIEALFDRDNDRWIEVPRRNAHVAFAAMERFTDGLDEADIQAQLRLALAGKAGFARFRAVLAPHPDLRARWQAQERAELLDRAIAWLHELGIEPRYELRQVAEPAAATPARPAVTLLDLLLLGAPDGKTELLGGRVLRQFVAADPARARKVFVSLGRELTEQAGIGWRKRFVENRNDYAIARCRLSVDDQIVCLEVEVPRAIWDAFAG